MKLHSFRQDLQDHQDLLDLILLYPVHPVDPVRKWKCAYPVGPSSKKRHLWERLPAAIVLIRGWKPLPQNPIHLLFPDNGKWKFHAVKFSI